MYGVLTSIEIHTLKTPEKAVVEIPAAIFSEPPTLHCGLKAG